MGYESYFRDPHLKKEADKIINKFSRLKKTLISINLGLKNLNSKMSKMIIALNMDNVSEELVEEYKGKMFDITSDLYGLIEKADSIILEMKTEYFSKSPKLEFKNRELIEEHEEVKKLTLKTYEQLKQAIEQAEKKLKGDDSGDNNPENEEEKQ